MPPPSRPPRPRRPLRELRSPSRDARLLPSCGGLSPSVPSFLPLRAVQHADAAAFGTFIWRRGEPFCLVKSSSRTGRLRHSMPCPLCHRATRRGVSAQCIRSVGCGSVETNHQRLLPIAGPETPRKGCRRVSIPAPLPVDDGLEIPLLIGPRHKMVPDATTAFFSIVPGFARLLSVDEQATVERPHALQGIL